MPFIRWAFRGIGPFGMAAGPIREPSAANRDSSESICLAVMLAGSLVRWRSNLDRGTSPSPLPTTKSDAVRPVTASENVALWHERDISHSSVERFIGPDATVTLDFALPEASARSGMSQYELLTSLGPRYDRVWI